MELWEKRLNHEKAMRNSFIEAGCTQTKEIPADPPGCLISVGPIRKFDGPKFWPLFEAKGHNSCIFESCKCNK